MLEQAVQHGSGRPRRMGEPVCVFHLTEDLRLTEDRRIQPRCDGERVMDGIVSAQRVQAFCERRVHAALFEQPRLDHARLCPVQLTIEFRAVAGRHDQTFLDTIESLQRGERRLQMLRSEGNPFANCNRRGSVIDADYIDGHNWLRVHGKADFPAQVAL